MLVVGVDPGLSGAVAFIDASTGVVVVDMPVYQLQRGGKAKRELDAHGLAAMFGRDRISHAFVEQVGAMPGQGVSSVFSFGKSFGIVLGILAAQQIAFTLVSPVVWKKQLGVQASKDAARARASQLLPTASHHWPLVKHDGRAEAALIAYWGLRSLQHGAAA